MALSKAAIAKHAGVFKAREVHVPELADESGDDVVLVRGMTLKEFEINQARNSDDGTASAAVLVRCILDANGARVFSDDDVRIVAELPLKAVAKLNQAIAEESGIVEPDSKDESVLDASIASAEKNSGATESDEPASN